MGWISSLSYIESVSHETYQLNQQLFLTSIKMASTAESKTFSWHGPYSLVETPIGKGEPADEWNTAASDMAIIHNVILRAFNAIYLQAPNIPKEKEMDFVRFCQIWAQGLHQHHSHEEDIFFPGIEEASGVKGIMEQNISQHAAFTGGLETFTKYIDDCLAGKEQYDGKKLVAIIDTFGETCAQHLRDEIPSISALRAHPNVPVHKLFEKTAARARKDATMTGLNPFLISNLDATFEGGIWKNSPPIPFLVKFLVANTFARRYAGSWEFSTCDMYGNPRELKYLAPVGASS